MNTEKLFKTALTETQQANSDLNLREASCASKVLASCPRRIVFELTNRCNFQCIMCGREAASFKATDLSVEMVRSFEPFYHKTEEVTLHGWGEGTLHPALPEILGYLNTFPKLRKYFVTNGSTLPRIRQHIFEHHVDLVAVSLDGSTAATNDSIRKGGSFVREVASVKGLIEEKSRRGLNYPYVNFVFTAMSRNIRELPGMVELASQAGVPEVKVVYLTVFNKALAHESLVDRQELVSRHFGEAASAAGRLGVRLKLPEIQGSGEAGGLAHKPCAFPWRDLYIGSDGFVRPCQSSADKLLDIRRSPTPMEAWNSAHMQRMRAAVNDTERMPRSCSSCYHSSCANWNLRTSFVQLGKAFAPKWRPIGAASSAPRPGAPEALAAKTEEP